MRPRWDLLSIRWNNRPMTASEYLTFSKGVLQTLARFDPMFNKLILWGSGPGKEVLLEPDSSEFGQKVFARMKDDDGDRVYQNPDPTNIKLTMDSRCRIAFHTSFTVDDGDDTGVDVSIAAGSSDDDTCLVNLEFSLTFHPQFYDHDFMQSLMKLLIAYCDPYNAFVISHPFWNQIELPPREDEVNSRVEPVGWFTYLANPRANALLPADVQREILPGGGVLISLQQAFPSEDDPAAVAAAIRIRDALQTEDLLWF